MQNLINTPCGEYVRGPIEADIVEAKAIPAKSGKIFFKAKLRDGQNWAWATSFSRTFEHDQGKRVVFSGMGIRRGDDYNGTPQVTIGDKASWKAKGAASPSDEGQPTPAPSNARSGQVNAPSAAPKAIEGVTVGMAINKGVDLAIARSKPDLATVYELASSLVRMAQTMQAGKLHEQKPLFVTDETPGYAAHQDEPDRAPTGDDEDAPF